ncbi:MAG TPA: haloacid dehalogenase-like hydrolase [Solirubrobacteraceae bacterium]|nr:haloacid dehalogenase-like hydrolase [Solirubrobacteraceae bacterium]
MTALLLFDIDGTLLRGATAAHAAALHQALRRVHGIDPSSERGLVDPGGRTDGEIARIILLGAGVSADRIDARADRVREECCRIYASEAGEDLSHTVLPGVRELLTALAAREDVRLALVTGNFEPIARMKLRQAGISSFFTGGPGGFGSDAEDRAALPAIARRRAGVGGVPWPRSHTIVIGDTPRDIACARADGLRCIAVATGPFAADSLQSADWLARDTAEVAALLREQVLGPG